MTPFSVNSTCAESGASGMLTSSRRSPVVVHLPSRERVVCFITAVREHHKMPAVASTASPFYPSAGACVGRGSCCSLVTGLSLYPHTMVAIHRGAHIAIIYSPRVEGLAPYFFVCCLCSSPYIIPSHSSLIT